MKDVFAGLLKFNKKGMVKMLHSKKLLSSILALSILASTALTSSVFAATNSKFKSDTNSDFSVVKGNIYTFKLTPANAKDVIILSTGNAAALQVVSNEKRANGSYYATVKAIGDIGSSTGVYASVKGDKAGTQLCVVKIAAANQTPVQNSSSVDSSVDPNKSEEGKFGIIEADDRRLGTDVGVLGPIKSSYKNRSLEEHLVALQKNIRTCSIINGGLAMTGSGSNASIRIIGNNNGGYGLRIYGWRSSKSSGNAGILNGALSAMVYFANSKDAGMSLWAWVDDTYVNGSANTADYGFKDASSNSIRYKGSGRLITIDVSDSYMDLIFTD